MKTLYVAWQQALSREWIPVARLDQVGDKYRFAYTAGAKRAEAFRPFSRMDDIYRIYESEELFPLIANRVLTKNRPEFPNYVRWTGETGTDPLRLLAVTGGLRGTDPIELFPPPSRTESGKLRVDFFARGLRHFAEPNLRAADELIAGARLYVMRDLQNEHDQFALCLRTADPSYLVGYCPKYYTQDICRLLDAFPDKLAITVKQVNVGAPLSMRLLCSLTSEWPEGFVPFAMNSDFKMLAAGYMS